MSQKEKQIEEKLAVVEIAITCLGKLALRGPRSKLNAQEVVELNQALMDCLEVLNDEKENH